MCPYLLLLRASIRPPVPEIWQKVRFSFLSLSNLLAILKVQVQVLDCIYQYIVVYFSNSKIHSRPI
jgi:hypothetical protein